MARADRRFERGSDSWPDRGTSGAVTQNAAGDQPDGSTPLGLAELEALVDALLDDGVGPAAGAAARVLEAAAVEGASEDLLVHRALPAAAHRLGELWERDEITFADVSIGLCRLQSIVRDPTWRVSPQRIRPGRAGPRVMMGTVAGDQHTFGLRLAADAFAGAGWRVTFAGGADANALLERLASENFEALALSSTNDIGAPEIASFISACRAASRSADLRVFVGGRGVSQGAFSARDIGADLILDSARGAPNEVVERIADASAWV